MWAVDKINNSLARVVGRIVDSLYLSPIRKFVTPQVFRYLACGVGNYLILDAILYFVCYHYVVDQEFIYTSSVIISPHVASLCIVFPITFVTGFWLNRHVAFRVSKEGARGQMFRYALSVGGSIILSYVILKFLVEGIHLWATPSKVICSLTTSLYSYLAAKYFTFNKKRAE